MNIKDLFTNSVNSVKTYDETINDPRDEVKATESTESEEWVWVEGYKGTDKDMKCKGYQYAIGERFDIPEGSEVKECKSGFHCCLELDDVFNYYQIGCNHRFFKVKALVRKEDFDNYGVIPPSSYSNFFPKFASNKLASKSIEFIEELDMDTILAGTFVSSWDEKYKKHAIVTSLSEARVLKQLDDLISLGYSDAFAWYCTRYEKYEIAYAVGSQPDLSMDVKVMTIFSSEVKR